MDEMIAQTALGAREQAEEQREIVRGLLDYYCSKFGGSREEFYQAAGLNSGSRFSSYVEGTGVSDITADELSRFLSLGSKLDKVRK